MRGEQADPATLLVALLEERRDLYDFDPDSPAARAALERILAAPAAPAARASRRTSRRIAFVAAAVAFACAALALALPSLSGPSGGTAQAAVLTRAAAALAPANNILRLQVQSYDATGGDWCIDVGVAPFVACDGGSTADAQTAISVDPADDTLTASYQEWLSPDHTVFHMTRSDGLETLLDTTSQQYESYDPAANTLTTLTDTGITAAPAAPASLEGAAGLPSVLDVSNPSYYEQLYQDAQAGTQNSSGETTTTAALVGPTTLAGEPVEELRFDIHYTPPANPPAGDMCGDAVCMPADRAILLYLDSATYLPVRSVTMLVNASDASGIPPGTSVSSVTNLSITSLPDTAANEDALTMSPHPAATTITETLAQYQTDRSAWDAARTSSTSPTNPRRETASRHNSTAERP